MDRADSDGRQAPAPVGGAAAGQAAHQSAPVSATFLQMRIITWVREERAVGELQATGGLTRCVCALDRSSQRRVAVSVWVAGGVGAAPGRSAHRFEIVVAVGEPCDLSAQRTCRTIGQGISSRSQHTREARAPSHLMRPTAHCWLPLQVFSRGQSQRRAWWRSAPRF